MQTYWLTKLLIAVNSNSYSTYYTWLVKLNYAACFGYFNKSLLLIVIEPQTGCFDNNLFEFSEVVASSKPDTVAFPVSLVVTDWRKEVTPFSPSLTQSMIAETLGRWGVRAQSQQICSVPVQHPLNRSVSGHLLGSAEGRRIALQEPRNQPCWF